MRRNTMRHVAKPTNGWLGAISLLFGCYLEALALESVHQGPTEYSGIVWLLMFASSLLFILLGLMVLWRQTFH